MINQLMLYIDIVEFIEKQLDYSDDEEMSDSILVKHYCEFLMSEVNNALVNELPDELVEPFKERTLYCVERFNRYFSEFKPFVKRKCKAINIDVNEVVDANVVVEINDVVDHVVNKPVIVEIDDKDDDERINESFMETLTEEFIEVNELFSKYNEYFGTEYKSSSFRRLK